MSSTWPGQTRLWNFRRSPATTLHLVDAEGKSIAHGDPDAAAPEFANVRSEITTLLTQCCRSVRNLRWQLQCSHFN